MDEDSSAIVILVCIAFAIGIAMGACGSMNYHRSKAVEAGAAEWVLKDKGPDTEFRWKGVPK